MFQTFWSWMRDEILVMRTLEGCGLVDKPAGSTPDCETRRDSRNQSSQSAIHATARLTQLSDSHSCTIHLTVATAVRVGFGRGLVGGWGSVFPYMSAFNTNRFPFARVRTFQFHESACSSFKNSRVPVAEKAFHCADPLVSIRAFQFRESDRDPVSKSARDSAWSTDKVWKLQQKSKLAAFIFESAGHVVFHRPW